jgi:hypothetical protein
MPNSVPRVRLDEMNGITSKQGDTLIMNGSTLNIVQKELAIHHPPVGERNRLVNYINRWPVICHHTPLLTSDEIAF